MLIAYRRDMEEKHQEMIDSGRMVIFTKRPFQVDVANFMGKPIHSTKIMYMAYGSNVSYYIMPTREEEASSEQQKQNGCGTKILVLRRDP